MGNDFRPDPIGEGLWVGRAPRSVDEFGVLADLGVQDVLTLQTEEETRDGGLLPLVARRVAEAHGMSLHRVPIADLSPVALRDRVAEAVTVLASLRHRDRRVYVHCALGLNRSPTVVAGWLALSQALDAAEACETVRALHRSLPDEEAVREVLRRRRAPRRR